jgi:hypothetical protein
MSIGWNTSNSSLQLYASVAVFTSRSLQLYLFTLASEVAHFMILEASPLEGFYIQLS